MASDYGDGDIPVISPREINSETNNYHVQTDQTRAVPLIIDAIREYRCIDVYDSWLEKAGQHHTGQGCTYPDQYTADQENIKSENS